MRWKVHGRRTMYKSDWVNVYLDDVELPDGTHIEHHVLTMPKASQTAVVLNGTQDRILLLWRHRFITDEWGWEVPAGWVETGEDQEHSIRREILEETGYLVGSIHRMISYKAIPGLSTMDFTSWLAVGATKTADPDGLEADAIDWKSIDEVIDLVARGAVKDGPSLTALSVFLTTRRQWMGEN